MYRSRLRRHYYFDLPEQQEEQIVYRRKLKATYAQGKVVSESRSHPVTYLSRTRPSWEFQARNYRRTRAQVRHSSHQHPLGPFEVEEQDGIICCGCELGLDGSAYGCLWCNFFLHKSCFDLPRELTHPFHQAHTLNLLFTPPKKENGTGVFSCKACGDQGGGFLYRCSNCNFDLHVDCARLPAQMECKGCHQQSLTLFESFPDKNGDPAPPCGICHKQVDKNEWIYYCRGCKFGVHVDCQPNSRSDPV